MFNIKVAFLVFAGLTVAVQPDAAFAKIVKHKGATPIVSQVTSKKSTLPPSAFIQYCVRNKSACERSVGKLATTSSGHVKLDKRLRTQLALVNIRVNAKMKPKRDAGVDIWASGGRYGDCEDYALTKRDLLIRSGWPSDALAMTVVKTPWGEGHAVLSVRTSRGTLVLDNLTYEIKKLKTTPYRVVAMQSADPLKWVGGTRF